MKILIVQNYAGDRQESMLRFSRMLTEGLPAHGLTVETIAPAPAFARLVPRYRYAGLPKYLGYLDKFVVFPRRLRRRLRNDAPAVLHITDHANAFYARVAGAVPALATCHDLLQIRLGRGEFPGRGLGASGRRFQAWMLRNLAVAPHLACISQKTADDLQRLAPRPAERLHVIPNGLNYPYKPVPPAQARHDLILAYPEAAAWLDRPGGYFLNVGGGQWYKNRAGLLRIHAALGRLAPANSRPALVMVGKPLAPNDAALARELNLGGDLYLLSGVTNDHLAALYGASRGLIFPSWEEGFGWPVAEAQACACPVFTSNRPPLTEVGGDAAVYFDPADPEAAAALILASATRADQLRARGVTRSARWSPDIMLAAYAALYRRIARPTIPPA